MEFRFGSTFSGQERNRGHNQVDGISSDLYRNGIRTFGLVNGIAMTPVQSVECSIVAAGVLRDSVVRRCALLGKSCNERPNDSSMITITYDLVS